eukprot:5888105-Prymnesium_polylepis.1
MRRGRRSALRPSWHRASERHHSAAWRACARPALSRYRRARGEGRCGGSAQSLPPRAGRGPMGR